MTTPRSRLRQLQEKNAQLRKAIIEISKRQEVLEEFIDLHFGDGIEFELFQKNRHRLMFALNYSAEDFLAQPGQRSPKSLELVRLLKTVKKYIKIPPRKNIRPKKTELLRPRELEHLGIGVDVNDGLVFRRPPKRCEKCYDPEHLARECPYKYEASRTPEVKAMIKERIKELKKIEINDPFLSKGYLKRHYKISKKDLKNMR